MSTKTHDRNSARRERELRRCIHFNGVQHRRCRAGVSYDDVRDPVLRPIALPCIPADWGGEVRQCSTTCAKFQAPTVEQVGADERDRQARIAEMGERARGGLCLHCGTKIERRVAVGRCDYAEPCGHRQGIAR